MNPIENLEVNGRCGRFVGQFVARATGLHGIGTIRLDHQTDEAFWLEIHLTTAQVKELLHQMEDETP